MSGDVRSGGDPVEEQPNSPPQDGLVPEQYDYSFEEVQDLLDASEQWVWVKDRDGVFVHVNEKMAREAHNLSADELRGTTDLEHMEDLSPEEEAQFRADDLEVLETGERKIIPQERLTTPDGKQRVLRTIKQPYETGLTDEDAILGIAVEITDRVETDKLVDLNRATTDLIHARSIEEVAEIAIRAVTDVVDQDYCTVWLPTDDGERLDLRWYSDAVARNAADGSLAAATAGPGDVQWERYRTQQTSVETKVGETIDPTDLPVDTPLVSYVLLPIGDYGLLGVGSFEQVLFKDTLATIVASTVEAAFERLEHEETLRAVGNEVDSTVTEVGHSTDEVAGMSGAVTKRASDQATTMETVHDGVAEMNAAIEEIAATAEMVDTTSSQAAALADDGKASAEDAKSAIDTAADSAEDAAADISQLQERVDEIDEIVDVIDGIADQTNILALNASIEAARAGEVGNGFAVVADEVKSLAEETQEQATEIETLVGDVQRDTDETVDGLLEMIDEIVRGRERVDETMASLVEVTDAVSEVSHGVSEVAGATDDQAASAEEISVQAERATELANEVAADAERIANANEEISEQVLALKAAFAEFSEAR